MVAWGKGSDVLVEVLVNAFRSVILCVILMLLPVSVHAEESRLGSNQLILPE